MAQNSGTSQKNRAAAPSHDLNALDLLARDHRELERLFEAFAGASGAQERSDLAARICAALTLHSQIEEELFYAAAQEELEDPSLVDRAIAEHRTASELIGEIAHLDPAEPAFTSRMRVLRAHIAHHFRQAERRLFPACERSGMDLDRIGRRMAQRRQELASALAAALKH